MAAAIALLAGCGGGDGGGDEQPRTSSVERTIAAIRDCRVRSVVALHSGVLVVELKDGGRIDLPLADQLPVYAEIERAKPRCGSVLVATE
jgi:hypothetical protein